MKKIEITADRLRARIMLCRWIRWMITCRRLLLHFSHWILLLRLGSPAPAPEPPAWPPEPPPQTRERRRGGETERWGREGAKATRRDLPGLPGGSWGPLRCCFEGGLSSCF